MREAALWSVAWFGVAMAFGGWMWWHFNGLHGAEVAGSKTLEYFTGYLLEKGLAIENVFIWITIFSYFAVPAELQKRLLLWGVVGAILMRGVLIYLGAVLTQAYSWVFYVFGAILLFTGAKMLLVTDKKPDLGRNPLQMFWLRRHLIGYLHNQFIHVPIELLASQKKHVDPDSLAWGAVLAATRQPQRFE